MAEDAIPEHEADIVTAQGDRIEIEENVPPGQAGSIESQNDNSRKWISFGALVLGSGTIYKLGFLKDIYGLPVVLVGAYGIVNQYGLKMLGGPIGGYIADKVTHSATRYIQIVFVLTAAALVAMTMLPHKSMNVYMGMTMTLMIGAFVFSMRAVFFAPMEEIKVRREITGAAMSLGSFIGYLPGAFLYTVYGAILDSNPGMSGYKYVMLCMAGFAVAGFFICSWLLRVVKKSSVQ